MQKFKGDLLNVIANKASRLKAARSRQAKPSFVFDGVLVCFLFCFVFLSKVGVGIPLQTFIGMIRFVFKHMVGMTNTLFYYFSVNYWQAYGILYLATFLRSLRTYNTTFFLPSMVPLNLFSHKTLLCDPFFYLLNEFIYSFIHYLLLLLFLLFLE